MKVMMAINICGYQVLYKNNSMKTDGNKHNYYTFINAYSIYKAFTNYFNIPMCYITNKQQLFCITLIVHNSITNKQQTKN